MFALSLFPFLLPMAVASTAQLYIFAAMKYFATIAAGVPADPAHCFRRVGHRPLLTYDTLAARVLFVAFCAILRH